MAGRAASTVIARCPYCAVPVELVVDPGGGGAQDYVEDCEVCCRPWRVSLRWEEGVPRVLLRTEDDA